MIDLNKYLELQNFFFQYEEVKNLDEQEKERFIEVNNDLIGKLSKLNDQEFYSIFNFFLVTRYNEEEDEQCQDIKITLTAILTILKQM